MTMSLLLLTAGILCLALAWYLSHYQLKKNPGILSARGLVNKIESRQEQHQIFYTLFLTFTLRSGKVVHYQEVRKSKGERWYAGMPVLVQYSIQEHVPEIKRIMSFRQAYANAFIIALLGILLIVVGTLFF